MTVNIRFCGGCNPRYDRGAFAHRLMDAYPGLKFSYNAEENTDAVIVLCGCTAACVKVSDRDEAGGSFTVCNEGAWDSVRVFLDSIAGK